MTSGASTISFTLSAEGTDKQLSKQFELKEGGVIKIGRSAGANFVIEHSGASQQHAEIRLLEDGKLCIKDVSSNGTGLKKANAEEASASPKDVDQPLEDGVQIVIPMRLKKHHNERVWITFSLHGSVASDGAAAGSSSGRKARAKSPSEDAARSTPEKQEEARQAFVRLLLNTPGIHRSTPYEKAEQLLSFDPAWRACDEKTRKECFHILVENLEEAPKAEKTDSRSAAKKNDRRNDQGADWENACKRFAELLLKTREIKATSTYAQAESILSRDPAWRACEEQTRMECFNHFVANLADTINKKKDKKKRDDKEKVKKRCHAEEPSDERDGKYQTQPPDNGRSKRSRRSRSREGDCAERSSPINARRRR